MRLDWYRRRRAGIAASCSLRRNAVAAKCEAFEQAVIMFLVGGNNDEKINCFSDGRGHCGTGAGR